MTDDELDRSDSSDELEVPAEPPDPDTEPHVLPDEKLNYPTFDFEDGTIDPDGTVDLETTLGREELVAWLDALGLGLESHEVAVDDGDAMAVFGLGAGPVSLSFEPDDSNRGTLEISIELSAKLISRSTNPEEPIAGSRGGRGFIPIEMLTEGPEANLYRCWNWIDDPLDEPRER